ncbi:MAG: peptidase [Burkholderiales bacterium PBB3]|nr:MAG: peptidase [Burkholderiales bacterium PBB3]
MTSKFLIAAGFLWALAAPGVQAAQTAVFHPATGGLALPSLAIGSAIYLNVELGLRPEDISLVSVGEARSVAQADGFPSYIATYDTGTQYLEMPRLQIGDTVYSKTVVRLGDVTLRGVGERTGASQLIAALPSRRTQNVCAVPRGADVIDPNTGRPYPDTQGTLQDELRWINSFVNDTYLWYKEVPTVSTNGYTVGARVDYYSTSTNARSTKTLTNNFDVVDAYFNIQRTRALTDSNTPVDQFHYTRSTAENNALFNDAAVVGFGVHWTLLAAAPPRKARVVYVDPNTPASEGGIARGATLISINAEPFATTNNVALLNEALYTPVAGRSYIFELMDVGATQARTVTMFARTLTEATVPKAGVLEAPHQQVGYLLFTGFLGPAELELKNAVQQLKDANGGSGITDLILDLRYNGGGYLTIASQLSFMIAGAARTDGKVFSQLVYNDKNPFAYTTARASTLFARETVGFSASYGEPLPQLGLQRVFVLTTRGTASASEETINALRGVGVEVIQIGTTTRGKPYGFSARDNCGVSYFTVQFKGLNHAGFGDYADGFFPGGTGGTPANLPGCVVADDFDHPLGDSAEALVGAALRYINTGSCSASRAAPSAARAKAIEAAQGTLIRDPIREIMLLDGRR